MASRSFLSLFLQTHEHLEVADRTQRFVVSVLLLVHLALLWPLATSQRLQEQEQAESKALNSILNALEDSSRRFEGAQEALQKFEPALEELVDDLRLDFIQLDAAVVEVRTAAVGTNSEQALAEEEEQAETATSSSASQPDRSNNPWVARVDLAVVREAQNRYSLLTALEPLVDEQLLTPRFDSLAEIWAQQTRSLLEGNLEALLSEFATLHPQRGELTATWDDLVASLGGLRRAVVEFHITPPERAYWWASPEEAPELQLGLVPATIQELRAPRALDELRVMMARTFEHRTALETKVRRALQDLADNSAAQFREDGRFLGIDLHSLLVTWPLLLGLLLAMVVLQRSYRLRQLGLLTTLMVEHGAPPNLSRWFLAEMRGALTPSKPSDPLSRTCLLQGLGLLSVGWLWIAIATFQAHGLRIATPPDIWHFATHWPALVGGAALFLAVLYRLHLNGQLIDLLREDLIEPPPELRLDEGEKEPFGIQDLRR